jgi:hypothetical protein
MTLKDRQRDYFNTQLIKLIDDAKKFYGDDLPEFNQLLSDLKSDIRREFDNSQFVK